jgi:hypothetical protein
LSIRIDVSEGTLLMISKVGIEEYCDVSQIGQGLARARHFSPGVTTDNDLRLSINMGLSSSLMLMKVSLFVLYWGFNCSAVPLTVVMFWVRAGVRFPIIELKTGFSDTSCTDNNPLSSWSRTRWA